MVLIQRLVYGGYLTLAKGIIERIVDRRRADAETCGGGAVNDQRRFEAAVLLVAVDVSQQPERAHGAQDTRRPLIQLADVVALQGELVLRASHASSHAQLLEGLHEESGLGHAGEFAAHPFANLVHGDLALFEGFERDEHARRIDRTAVVAAGEAEDVVHRRILTDQAHELLEDLPRGLKRTALVGLNLAK